MNHFIDLRILLTRKSDGMIVGKTELEILRQFNVSIPIGEPRDAEQIMDLLVMRLSDLFEKLGTKVEKPHEGDTGTVEEVLPSGTGVGPSPEASA